MDRTNRAGTVLYHGTDYKFREPKSQFFKDQKDFGPGFYLTTDYRQAEKFTQLKLRQSKSSSGYVNSYWISNEDLGKLKICTIDNGVDWLRYILLNRGYNSGDIEIKNKFKDYDVLCGKVADARISEVLNRYVHGGYIRTAKAFGITPEEVAIRELNVEAFENQIVFKTERSLKLLKYIKAKVIQ